MSIDIDSIEEDSSIEFVREEFGRVRIYALQFQEESCDRRLVGSFYTRDLLHAVLALQDETPAPIHRPARLPRPSLWDRLLGRVEDRN